MSEEITKQELVEFIEEALEDSLKDVAKFQELDVVKPNEYIQTILYKAKNLKLNQKKEDETILQCKAKPLLQGLYEDCEMALDGTWDRSDKGFEASRDAVERLAGILGIKLDPYVPETDEEEE